MIEHSPGATSRWRATSSAFVFDEYPGFSGDHLDAFAPFLVVAAQGLDHSPNRRIVVTPSGPERLAGRSAGLMSGERRRRCLAIQTTSSPHRLPGHNALDGFCSPEGSAEECGVAVRRPVPLPTNH